MLKAHKQNNFQLPTQMDDDEHLCFEACLCHQEAFSVHQTHSDSFFLAFSVFWPVRLSRLGIVPSKIRSTRSSATIPPPLCWREPEPEAVEDSSTPTEGWLKQTTKLKQSELQKMAFFLSFFLI